LDLFDAKVDGEDLQRLGISGKPAPDMLLRAAEQLGVAPSQSLIVEDAVAGVQAGRAGDFAVVIGVVRDGNTANLRQAGADVVVHDLRELRTAEYCPPDHNCLRSAAPALSHAQWITSQIDDHRLALFLDYDGTLTPIVRRPEDARLSDQMRSLLGQLAGQFTVAIVSGRDRHDVQRKVQVPNLVYAGSHGFDIQGPQDLQLQQQDAQQAIPELDAAQGRLQQQLAGIGGSRVERKRFSIAVHYREVAEPEGEARVEQVVDRVRDEFPALRKTSGKKIFELQPNVPWDKGAAVLWLREALGLDQADVPVIYIGDDTTDEDAFRALRLRGAGIGMAVAPAGHPTQAIYYLRDCDEVYQFLKYLLDHQRTDST
jgi:alpha,alpha-trehalase